MYTQCPDCDTAFRVTAEILRQAAGKVRCGGCGHAFNALLYLSETKPGVRPRPAVVESLPELRPEITEHLESLPRPALSAAQSAALLKTLDQLAGEDIRLEDTGVEWRLLGQDDDDANNDEGAFPDASDSLDGDGDSQIAVEEHNGDIIDFSFGVADRESGDPPGGDEHADDVESVKDAVPLQTAQPADIDEVLDDAPTPVDEVLDDAPSEVESVEVFADSGSAEVEAQDVFENPETRPEDVLRFDDNTGLPDNFDVDSLSVPVLPDPEPEKQAVEETSASAPDIAFGDPEEWGDLLDEVEPLSASEPESESESELESESECETFADTGMQVSLATRLADEQRGAMEPTLADELAALPDEPDDDGDEDDTMTPFDPVAAAGIDLSGIYASPSPAPREDTAGDDGATEACASSDDVAVDEPEVSEPEEAPEVRIESEPAPDERPDEPEAGGPEGNGAEAAEQGLALLDTDADDDEALEPVAADTGAGADENADETIAPESMRDEPEIALAAETETAQDDDGQDSGDAVATEADESEPAELLAAAEWQSDTPESLWDMVTSEDPPAADAGKDAGVKPKKPFPENTGELEFELVAARLLDADEPEFDPTRTIVPTPTDEEHTVNMLIDQDLLRLALPDEDGMASTIVLEGRTQKHKTDKADRDAAGGAAEPEADSLFETIIMEGDFARTAREQERLAAEAEARAREDAKKAASQESAQDRARRSRKRRLRYGLIACIVALALLLVGQFVHQSRAELATIPAVGDAIAPIYRAVGSPVAPQWNVRGWRFEVSHGATSEMEASGGELPDLNPGEEVLTIYSRLGNKSDAPLPLPLITVALTDRFEEVIGSKVLEPADYLAEGASSSEFVQPGETFDAVIAVAAPGDQAAGFKLNVCYRQDGGQLRCALDDFKK